MNISKEARDEIVKYLEYGIYIDEWDIDYEWDKLKICIIDHLNKMVEYVKNYKIGNSGDSSEE